MTGNNQPRILKIDRLAIAEAVDILQADGLVAVPTETVYGLAARADSDLAVAGIYYAKGRPDFNPLIVHVSDLASAERLAIFDDRARALAKAFWPGPLTLVLPKRPDATLAAAVTAGLPTVALRCPAHPAMRAVLSAVDFPLAAPSANPSGSVSPTCADHVARSLGNRLRLILDGGSCESGLESTIVALRNFDSWQMLRSGPISEDQIIEIIGKNQTAMTPSFIEAPGQMASHYSPGKPMRLDAEAAAVDEYHIGFGKIGGNTNLSLTGDLTEAAANLYAALHLAGAAVQPNIAVVPIPCEGLGIAINDRLRRAAA